MKRTVCTAIALSLISVAATFATARAADMAVKAPMMAPAVEGPLWSGYFIGGNAGYAWGKSTWCTDANVDNCTIAGVKDTSTMTPDGAVGGIQTGYRFQYGNFVFGPEAMLDAATIHSSVADPRFAGATRNTNFSGLMDVTGDIGLAFDRVMLYGKGGWALSHISLDATSPASGDVKGNQFIDGWVAGGGIEYALPSGFTVGIEYNYFGFKPGQGLANTGGGVLAGPCVACNFTNTNVQTIMARLNVRVGPAP